MNSRALAAEYRLSHWAHEIQERVNIGESVTEFCQRRGISRNTYFYRQRKLREVASRHLEALRNESARAAGFTEVKLDGSLALPEPDSRKQGHVCIEIGDVRISAGGEYPADKLVTLARELRVKC